ncbi:SIS domain-containing protein [Rhodospirillum sp. A1_3_36]|uniref:SIS domain-containing protein n=1 Tax=Rhodospirillum sp. A1_3_36 TaxID=3391666 RepID=UPI0039A5A84A
MGSLEATAPIADDVPPIEMFAAYSKRLSQALDGCDWSIVAELAEDMLDAWKTGKQVFFCGNGGSAGNAVHLANDFIYGIGKTPGSGIRSQALPANAAVLTCLANDEGYDQIYSIQLGVLARAGDILIALSGSGNSPNILKALEEGKRIGMKSYAVLGYSGGKAKALADRPIHLAINDMQISEDAQVIIGHMVMQYLWSKRHEVVGIST